jgi:signal transduction histidine kinase
LFNNLRISIFVYYFITVVGFLLFSYYFLVVLALDNYLVVSIVGGCFITLSGIFISKLAVDPLLEYVQSLQNLSKETLHELNLPISTIMTNSQMLEKSMDDAKSLKRLGRINSACDMLKERYNELDYMIKMQTKEEILEKFDVSELVEQRITFLSKIYPQINFNLSLKRLEILSDKKGLSKVIDNLIDNGVKYSTNSKNIDINMKEKNLFIQDYGVGMEEVELLRIFDNYYQSNVTVSGFGIGLSMVKRFCDKNKIELNFSSTPKVGTTVVLRFKNI